MQPHCQWAQYSSQRQKPSFEDNLDGIRRLFTRAKDGSRTPDDGIPQSPARPSQRN